MVTEKKSGLSAEQKMYNPAPGQSSGTPDALPRQLHPHLPFTHDRPILLYLVSAMLLMGGVTIAMLSMSSTNDIRSRATNTGTVLSIDPSAKTLKIGQTTTVGILLNTNTDTVSAAEIHISYDKTAVQVIGFTKGAILPVVLSPATTANGAINFIYGSQPTAPFKGSGILASFTIKILSAKQSTIHYNNSTQIAAIGKAANALAASSGSTITGIPAVTPTPTKKLTGTPTKTPTPTKKPSGTPTRTPTPTKTPTGTVTPTHTPTPTQIPGTTETPTPTPEPTSTPTPMETPSESFGNLENTPTPTELTEITATPTQNPTAFNYTNPSVENSPLGTPETPAEVSPTLSAQPFPTSTIQGTAPTGIAGFFQSIFRTILKLFRGY